LIDLHRPFARKLEAQVTFPDSNDLQIITKQRMRLQRPNNNKIQTLLLLLSLLLSVVVFNSLFVFIWFSF